jgi:hypothetical protein
LSADDWKTGLTNQYPQTLQPAFWGQIGTIIHRKPGNAVNKSLAGITRDSAGAPLGSCVTELLQSGGDILKDVVTSDGSGNFTFSNPGSGPFFVRSYKDGAPNLAGVTDRNLIAV